MAKNKEKSFDVGQRRIDDKRRSSTLAKGTQRDINAVRPPPIQTVQQDLKQILKTNETETRGQVGVQSATSKNWIIRKNNSIKKDNTPQLAKKEI